jgi:hypothetical protein
MYRAHVSRWSNRQLPQVATHELLYDEEDGYDIKRGVMDTLILDGELRVKLAGSMVRARSS